MGFCVYYRDVDGGIRARDMEGWGSFGVVDAMLADGEVGTEAVKKVFRG